MSAGVFILILVVAIAALVLMIVKAKMHPVLALFIAALGTGIALGYGVTGSVDYISNGFGGTLGSVGITIILGAIISMAIEDTGAAKVIANFFIKLFRGKRMELAPAILVDTKAMLNSLDRVSVVISEKLKSPVHCIFDAGRVYLSAKTGNGEAKDICPVEGDGQGLEIGFNNRFFMDALRYAPPVGAMRWGMA